MDRQTDRQERISWLDYWGGVSQAEGECSVTVALFWVLTASQTCVELSQQDNIAVNVTILQMSKLSLSDLPKVLAIEGGAGAPQLCLQPCAEAWRSGVAGARGAGVHVTLVPSPRSMPF